MKRKSNLLELHKYILNVPGNMSITIYKDHDRTEFDYGYIDFDRREAVLIVGEECFRTEPIKNIFIGDDTLHKTFFMESYNKKCFEIVVYRTAKT